MTVCVCVFFLSFLLRLQPLLYIRRNLVSNSNGITLSPECKHKRIMVYNDDADALLMGTIEESRASESES